MTSAQARVIEYSRTAGCGRVHHGTRLARKLPAGTQAAATPATRATARRRRPRASPRPQGSTAMTVNKSA